MSTKPNSGKYPTAQLMALPRDMRRKADLRCVGILTPTENAPTGPIRIEGAELIIGREPECGTAVGHETVSRNHARIVRDGDTFLIEDLGSSNGTCVAGLPVMRCPLHDGDTVRFGGCVYYFERTFESVPKL